MPVVNGDESVSMTSVFLLNNHTSEYIFAGTTSGGEGSQPPPLPSSKLNDNQREFVCQQSPPFAQTQAAHCLEEALKIRRSLARHS
ncbi:hypothetical protein CEXT_336561 [Caerostris extrusa]|uniref:Uncharacterized protein n=1 Tax=Caerostris extrusa TaxID=172846 RepID=A0AAV4XDA9_CAEEX|nr:hypothetical protein CEXT_336561 [Caerostris extrusa]